VRSSPPSRATATTLFKFVVALDEWLQSRFDVELTSAFSAVT
jgi:hypothetical protein